MQQQYIANKKTNGANPFKIFEAIECKRDEVLANRLKKMAYSEFIETAYWFAVSTVAKSRAGMRCQVCNSPDKIQTHHRTYDTHGYEHLNMADLVVLCHNCHGLFHGHQPLAYKPQRLLSRKEKHGVVKEPLILPHTVNDLTMPEGDPIVLTKELIDRCRANGSFTNATIRAFGLGSPLTHRYPIYLLKCRNSLIMPLYDIL